MRLLIKRHRPSRQTISVLRVLFAALPIMVGYLALGIPCGILGAKAGMSMLQIILLCVLLYSGSGQFMISSMTMGGIGAITTALTVSLVNARQLLYASALLPHFSKLGKAKATLSASNITDESFGVNITRLERGNWSHWQVLGVSCFSQASWLIANIIGAILGSTVNIDTAVASFAMTSIFMCLLLMQKFTFENTCVVVVTALAVIVCKLAGFTNIAVFAAAICGVVGGVVVSALRRGGAAKGGSA